MTHQQLGHENDVRRWYNVAIEHTKKEDANDQQPALYRRMPLLACPAVQRGLWCLALLGKPAVAPEVFALTKHLV